MAALSLATPLLLTLGAALTPRPSPRPGRHPAVAATTTLLHAPPIVDSATTTSAIAALLDAGMSASGAAAKDAVQREAATAILRQFYGGAGNVDDIAPDSCSAAGGASGSRATVWRRLKTSSAWRG